MYPAHTQLVAKCSSPSIGDQRATGCGDKYIICFEEVATFGCGGASCCARRSESEIDIDRVDKNCCEEVLAALIFTATFRMDCTIEMEISNFQKSR